MNNSPTTAWLKPTNHTKGLDPLGAQAPAINLYGQLLPGITNVTDRARYYSFYPWMIVTFERLPGEKTYEGLRDWVRRCDCLFTMIGIRHGLIAGDDHYALHARALIGSSTLSKVVHEFENGAVAHLSDFTVLEDGNPQRYFKNRLGGMQQYYIGTFDGLGLMTRQGRSVANTHEVGVPLAEAMDAFVERELFIETVRSGEVTSDILDSLAAFCPCQLIHSHAEHSNLLDLFFARKEFDDDMGRQRRSTLGLMLDLIRSLSAQANEHVQFGQNVFRACVYTGALPDGSSWPLPEGLEATRKQWRVYQGHELLSAALQCIFWVALRKIKESKELFWNTQEFMNWFSEQDDVQRAAERLGSESYSSLLQQSKFVLPELKDWQNNSHEVQLALKALGDCNENNPGDYATILENAARVLLAVAARDTLETSAYSPLEFPQGFLMLYPLNLESLRKMSTENWNDMAPKDWLAWLAGNWGVEAHLRVALRKLRFQNKDTLHVFPTDHGLVVQEMPSPSYTSPRFNQGVQILEDLGAVSRPPAGAISTLTPLGESLWSETHV